MKPLQRLIAVLISLVLAASETPAQTPLAAPFEGVLILKNGNALQGRITQAGEYYVLAINDNSVIRLPQEKVDFACRTMEEAYLRQKAKEGTTTLKAHVELAHWCLNLNLWEEATYHHSIAQRSGPGHPDVVRLDRRYQVKQEERRRPEGVMQASFTQPVATPEPAADRPLEPRPAEPSPGDDEAEPSPPPQILHYFTANVQPLLLNSCATSRCHAPTAENEFRLVQFDNVRLIPRRMTVRNMNTALKFVDYDNPVQSSLLTHASTQHGGENEPNLSPAQLYAIQAWVGGVVRSGKPPATLPAALPESKLPESKVVPAAFHSPVQMSTAKGAASQPTVSPVGANPDGAEINPIFGGNANADIPGALRRGAPLPFRSTPKTVDVEEAPAVRDEFDPELFNRRYHPSRQAPLFQE